MNRECQARTRFEIGGSRGVRSWHDLGVLIILCKSCLLLPICWMMVVEVWEVVGSVDIEVLVFLEMSRLESSFS